jgi:hypothetical protein
MLNDDQDRIGQDRTGQRCERRRADLLASHPDPGANRSPTKGFSATSSLSRSFLNSALLWGAVPAVELDRMRSRTNTVAGEYKILLQDL